MLPETTKEEAWVSWSYFSAVDSAPRSDTVSISQVARLLGTGFNYATLFENVTGSVVMGLLVGYFAFKGGVPQHWRLFLTTGILGGYTTFSAFSLDTILLYERGELGLAALYVILSVALSVGGLLAGLVLVRQFT